MALMTITFNPAISVAATGADAIDNAGATVSVSTIAVSGIFDTGSGVVAHGIDNNGMARSHVFNLTGSTANGVKTDLGTSLTASFPNNAPSVA